MAALPKQTREKTLRASVSSTAASWTDAQRLSGLSAATTAAGSGAVEFGDLDLAGLEADAEVAGGVAAAGVEEPHEQRAVPLVHRRHRPPGLPRVDERPPGAWAAARGGAQRGFLPARRDGRDVR